MEENQSSEEHQTSLKVFVFEFRNLVAWFYCT